MSQKFADKLITEMLYPSELVLLALLPALLCVGNRVFYRCLTKDYGARYSKFTRTNPSISLIQNASRLGRKIFGDSDVIGRCSDTGFHTAKGNLENLKCSKRGFSRKLV